MSKNVEEPPVPRYLERRVRDLTSRLEEAFNLRDRLLATGSATDSLDSRILELKREIRSGPQLQPGEFIAFDRIQILERIGQGGFSTVWRAYDRKRKELVALKVLHGQFSADQSRRARFARGARIMARLEHPAIVKVLDQATEDEGFTFFVLELVSGGDFGTAVLEGGFEVSDRLSAILRIGEALSYAHSLGIVHRDVKPSNILLDSKGSPKLTDFDLVRAVDTTGGTRTGMLGTVVYAAPEAMSRSVEATSVSDVYSLGMTALFAIAGQQLPLSALRSPASIAATADVSEEIQLAILKAVAWDPAERWATVNHFSDALRAALDTAVLAPQPPEDQPTIFISYAREDVSAAARIYQDLKRLGLNPWLDVEDLLPGEQWKLRIINAIRKSSHFIALISTRSVNKNGFVQRELREALEVLADSPPDQVYILPLRLDPSEPKHEQLRDLSWVDLFPSYYDGFRRVISVLAPEKSPRDIELLLRDRILVDAEAVVIEKLRHVYRDFPQEGSEIPDDIFLGVNYGFGFWKTEMEYMVEKGLIEKVGNRVVLTGSARAAVQDPK